MKKILLILAMSTIISCTKSEESGPVAFYLSTKIELSVINSESEDLLNPAVSSRIDVDKIKIYNVIDGQTQVSSSQGDNPRNFSIYKNFTTGVYKVKVTLNHSEKEEKPITYIQWSDDVNDRDTIEAVFKRTETTFLKHKIWVNGNLVWNITKDVNNLQSFVLVK